MSGRLSTLFAACPGRRRPLSSRRQALPLPTPSRSLNHTVRLRVRHYIPPSQPSSNSPDDPPGPPPNPPTTEQPFPAPQPPPAPNPPQPPPQTHHEVHERTSSINMPVAPLNLPGGGGAGGGGGGGGPFTFTNSPLLDALLTTAMGLGAGGIAYVKWYKKNVLDKIESAFQAGYDPALELAKSHTAKKAPVDDASIDPILLPADEAWTQNLRRKEQEIIDHIVHGDEAGHYFMLIGPKGAGKGTMIFDAMAACNAEGVSMCDAHPDLEVFRLRLGKALNFEYNEDTQTGLFQRRDPREGGPALDIERGTFKSSQFTHTAMNKLEKVALRCAPQRGKPFVLIINNVHFFQNDEGGRNMLLQLQQKAEAWAASGRNSSRMHVISIYDLNTQESLQAASRMRRAANRPPADPEDLKTAVSFVGGRLAYLNKVSKAKDMVGMARHLLEVEKAWLLSQIGLIADCDDDVMDEQKWSSCSWLLLREFVKQREEQETALAESGRDAEDLPLPTIPYWKCRQIMTRADFLEDLDRLNIISIDIQHNVRPDSNLILHAAQEVCKEEGFDELLDNVRDRIDEIESLHRTRELTVSPKSFSPKPLDI
ncbi:hypothetical protein CVT26_015658 [Gymnopilus dilepis]|uniref:AAA protein C-terminal winged helix domain-containing protein n=1 Tax=Gymnopilus dilepis TaxID=231916 RepID=A0A409VFA4_9AGAR|nr:hypothetical protein CVT26_015658 [Gymnopilus dilepis]